MKTSTYIDLLVKEIGSHLWRVSDNERTAYHAHANSINPPGQAVNYKSIHIRDFIDFYIKELEFTPKQFMDALTGDRRLIEILYTSYNSFLSDRRDFQELFEPVIKKDPGLFTLALKECLNTHHNLYEHLQPDNKELPLQIERNTEDFKRLLKIGQEEDLFRKLPKDVLYTKNSQYKKIIQESGLLDNEAFSEKKLIDLFFEAAANRKYGSNFYKITEYCLFYIKDIVQKFDSPETFSAWAASHVNVTKNKDGNTVEIIDSKSFFLLITKDVNDESRPHQDKIIDQWLDNESFRHKLSSGYSSDLSFFSKHPHKIIDYLNKLTSEEKVELINKGGRDCDFERGHYDFKDFINKLPLENVSPLEQAKVIEKIIDFRKEPRNSDDVMTDNAFFSAALNHLVAKSLKSIKASSISDEEKEQAKLNVLGVYAKNNDIIVSMIHNAPNAINKNIHNLESNIQELRLHKKDLNLSNDFFDNLESIASYKLEAYLDKQKDKHAYNYMTNLALGIRNSIFVVSALGIYSVLDKLKIIDVKINKEVRVPNSKRSKYLEDYPMIFDIVENTKDKGVLSWILQEKHLPILKEVALYKNKNIVEFFSNYDDQRGSNQPIIERLFEVMMQDKVVFKELVLAKRKTLNSVKDLKSDFIQTSLNVATLENKLKTKDEEPVKRVSKKI